MSQTDTKIQINSVKALERLIGGDSEVEFELRKSVVVEFAKRHLKEIVADPAMQKAIHDVSTAVQIGLTDQIAEYKTNYFGKIEQITFSKEVQEEIKKRAQDAFNDLLKEQFQDIRIEALKNLREKTEGYIKVAVEVAMSDVRKDTLARVKRLLDGVIGEKE